jgi:predicted dehydrogenase
MGPYYVTAIVALLGPIRRVAGFASTRAIDRVIEIGPRAGTPFTPETPTHTAATLELDGGVTANLTATFEAGAQYIADFTVYGTEGRLILPDPNSYGGPLQLRRGREEAWQDVPLPPPSPRDGRGLGLADLVTSVGTGAAPRASGELGLHVVEVARGILAAAEAGESVAIASAPARPAPLAARDRAETG